jgi:hypothetical protein
MKTTRRALTLVEVLIGAAVLFLALAMIWSFFASAGTQTGRSVGSSDAVRSVLIATEFIRYDVARMRLVKATEDLAIFDDGRALSVRVPRDITADFWNYTWDPVTYRLQAVPGTEAKVLVRQDSKSKTQLANCYLADMLVRTVDVGEASRLQSYLEVSLVGVGGPSSKEMYTSVCLIPLTVWAPPVKYEVPSH